MKVDILFIFLIYGLFLSAVILGERRSRNRLAPTMLECVREFHKRFDCYTAERLSLPSATVVALRRSLIKEEYTELMLSMENGDLTGIADAIADLHYVLSGTSLAYGIPEDAVFEEVHRSNMDKAEPDGTVHRRYDGKILKAARWTPPDIEEVLRSRSQ